LENKKLFCDIVESAGLSIIKRFAENRITDKQTLYQIQL